MTDALTGITAFAIYARKSNEHHAARSWRKTQESTSNWDTTRIHSSLRVTPAMAAGVTDRVWGLAELLRG